MNISVKDLRIGNLFQEQYTGQIIEVIGLNADDQIVFSGDFKDKWQAQPIPLTENCLIDAGALSCDSGTVRGIDIDRFKFLWLEKYKYWYVVDKGSLMYVTKIEFVHELQNFFQSVNGQELTIKP